ncbi:MAG: rSAM-modified peptide [bacterium]|nr:rSAM-modified peptide [bacterium]
MKTKKINKKLALNKTTISRLDDRQLGKIKGGGSWVWTCAPCDTFMNSCLPCMMVPTGISVCVY